MFATNLPTCSNAPAVFGCFPCRVAFPFIYAPRNKCLLYAVSVTAMRATDCCLPLTDFQLANSAIIRERISLRESDRATRESIKACVDNRFSFYLREKFTVLRNFKNSSSSFACFWLLSTSIWNLRSPGGTRKRLNDEDIIRRCAEAARLRGHHGKRWSIVLSAYAIQVRQFNFEILRVFFPFGTYISTVYSRLA